MAGALREMMILLLLGFLGLCVTVTAQLPIPRRYDGFVFNNQNGSHNLTERSEFPVLLEAFLDPLCPDSRDSWPALKKVVLFHSHSLLLIVHPFALPYHHNSFFSCRALHIMNGINSNLTFGLLEKFFKDQSKFSNAKTADKTPASILRKIVKLASSVYKHSKDDEFAIEFEKGFNDTVTDMATRVSFKYGCSRSVTGTPYFFLNGIPLYDADQSWGYTKWRSIIDPLVYETSPFS